MITGRLAVLSNVNMNMVIRMLQKNAQVYEAEGYGNELGTLLNPQSSYHAYHAEITFLIMDLAELLEHDRELVPDIGGMPAARRSLLRVGCLSVGGGACRAGGYREKVTAGRHLGTGA